MDKKVFLAVALCAAIFLVWQKVYLKPYAEQRQAQQEMQALPTAPAQSTATTAPATASNAPTSIQSAAKMVTIGDTGFRVAVSTKGGAIAGIEIPEYRGKKTDDLGVLIGAQGQTEITTPSREWAFLSTTDFNVSSQNSEKVVLTHDDDNVSIQRTYAVQPKIFSVDQQIDIKFKKQPPAYLFVGVQARRDIPNSLSENERREIWFNKAGAQEKWAIGDIAPDKMKEDLGQGYWAGISSRYFLNAIIDQTPGTPGNRPQFQTRYLDNGDVTANLIYRITDSTSRISLRNYYGPKDVDLLKEASPNLNAVVDFGWFTVIAYPLLKALKWFYNYVHNYGIAIILLTILVKVVTYPLTLKSMKSMKEMQRIQPQLAALREKHKDDKEKLNREMLQLMKANGYNPMGGCFPIFIQMPIFVALYNVLYGAIDLVNAPFFGWIHDLSAKDPFYITPILLAGMMFLQQKLTPNTATDPAQQRMMMMMPVIFGFMMLWLPSGLTLYMLVNSVVSIVQQLWINRSLGGGAPRPAQAT